MPDVPKDKVAFFQSDYWSDHFLKYVKANQNPQSVTSPEVVQLHREYAKFEKDTPMTREKALAFVNGPLSKLHATGDPQVDVLVSGYSRAFSLDSMKEAMKDDDSWNKAGKKVIEGLGTKASYHIQSEYADYQNWLGTDEGKASISKTPEKPSVIKHQDMQITDKSKATVQRVGDKAKLEEVERTRLAMERLGKADIPVDQQAQKLQDIQKFIKDAPLTMNFRPSHGEIGLFESMGGRTPVWAAPQAIQDGVSSGGELGGYSGKRQQVEERYFGITGNPYKDHADPGSYDAWGDRPVYCASNLGGGTLGATDQYGSCYFVLKDSVKDRVTYASQDTFSEGSVNYIGAGDKLEGVIADIPEDRLKLIDGIMTGDKGAVPMGQNAYVEAQVHGPLRWKDDVAKMVIDRSVVPEGSEIDQHIMRFAKQNNIAVESYDMKEWQAIAWKEGPKVANQKISPKPVDVDLALAKAQNQPMKVTPHLAREAEKAVKPLVDQRTVLQDKLKQLETKPTLGDRLRAIPKGGLDAVKKDLAKQVDQKTEEIAKTVNKVYADGEKAKMELQAKYPKKDLNAPKVDVPKVDDLAPKVDVPKVESVKDSLNVGKKLPPPEQGGPPLDLPPQLPIELRKPEQGGPPLDLPPELPIGLRSPEQGGPPVDLPPELPIGLRSPEQGGPPVDLPPPLPGNQVAKDGNKVEGVENRPRSKSVREMLGDSVKKGQPTPKQGVGVGGP